LLRDVCAAFSGGTCSVGNSFLGGGTSQGGGAYSSRIVLTIAIGESGTAAMGNTSHLKIVG